MASPYLDPDEAEYANVGRITIYWSFAEYMIETLIWRYIGDVDKGHIVTAQLGSQSLTDILEALVSGLEEDTEAKEAITHAVEGFHILRVNRNKIVHSYNFLRDADQDVIRFSGRKKVRIFEEFEPYVMTKAELKALVHELYTWNTFLSDLVDAVTDRWEHSLVGEPHELRPWPRKPPLPKRLTPLRPVAQPGQRHRPQSSRE